MFEMEDFVSIEKDVVHPESVIEENTSSSNNQLPAADGKQSAERHNIKDEYVPKTEHNSDSNSSDKNIKEEATEDESMAVEALWQLGGGVVNEIDSGKDQLQTIPPVSDPTLVPESDPDSEPVPIPMSEPIPNNPIEFCSTFGCESCGMTFPSKVALHIHHSICESRIKKVFTCTICNETFEKISKFENHKVCHQVSRPYSCRSCGSLFKQKLELQNHACSPTVQNLQCQTCSMEFSRTSSLINHMKVHCYVPGRALVAAALASGEIGNPQQMDSLHWPESHSYPTLLPQLDLQTSGYYNKNITEMPNWNLSDPLANEELPDSMDIAQEMTVNTTYSNDLEQSMPFQNDFEDLNQPLKTETSNESDNRFLRQDTLKNSPVKVETLPYILPDNPTDSLHFTQNQSENDLKKKPHSCKFCGVSFTRAKALISHERLHQDYWNEDFECKKCGDIFNDSLSRKVHICKLSLQEKYRISCNVIDEDKTACKVTPSDVHNNSFNNEDDLELNEYLAEDDSEESELIDPSAKIKQNKHACLQCSKRFTTKQKMFRHMWIHRKKTFSCEVCGETFSLQNQLDTHRLASHPGNTPHGCTTCGKCFASRQGLWEHTRTHKEGAAAHQCQICSKEFASRQGFLIHSRTHTGERPYGCRFCLKAFRDGGTLRKHERIHTGERPHICPLCLRAFNQKVVLREHVRWVHAAAEPGEAPNPRFSCQLCPQILSDREDLCAHIVKHSDLIAARDKQKPSNVSPDSKPKTQTVKLRVKKDIYPPIDTYKTKLDNVYQTNFANVSVPVIESIENESVELPCDMCGDMFTSKEALLMHVRIHI